MGRLWWSVGKRVYQEDRVEGVFKGELAVVYFSTRRSMANSRFFGSSVLIGQILLSRSVSTFD